MSSINTSSPLIKRSRQEAVFMASSLIRRCLDATLAALEDAEKQARSVLRRQQLGDAIAALVRQRNALRSGYAAQVDQAIASALRNADKQDAAQPSARPEHSAPGFELTLIEDEEVTRFVEASRLQQAAMPVVEEELTQLDSLISSALGLPVVRADLNPLRPDVLCTALLELMESLPESPAARSQWVRHMAKPFARELKQLYATIVQLLQEQGVEEARYRLKLTEGGAPPPAKAAPGQATANAAAPTPTRADTSRAPAGGSGSNSAPRVRARDLARAQPAIDPGLMRDFLYKPQWSAEHDAPLPADYYQAVRLQAEREAQVPEASYDEAQHARQMAQLRALSAVDRPHRSLNVGAALSPKLWGEQASPAHRARTLTELKSQARQMSQALGLNAVRALVNQVADDERVLAPVREAFIALEPALLRMALADPRFFGDEQHPARRLVEDIAQRSFKYNNEFDDAFEQFMQPVRHAVRTLNRQPEASALAFARELKALQTRWQTEDADQQHLQDKGLRSMQFAQERQALADKIAHEFSLRSDLLRVPAIVADFLFDVWSLVIAHAQLTDTRGQLDPGGYLSIVTDLLWSVKREEILKEPAHLFYILPPLLQTLRRGLDMLGKDPIETQPFFAALMQIHGPVLQLRRLRSALDAEASGFAPSQDMHSLLSELPADAHQHTILQERPQPKPKADSQPWLGRHELADAGFEDGLEVHTLPLPLPPGADASNPDSVLHAFEAVATTLGAGEDDDFPPTQPLPHRAQAEAAPPAAEASDDFAPTQPLGHDIAPGPAAAPAEAQDAVPPSIAAGAALPPAQAPAPAPATEAEPDDETLALIERLRKGDWVDLRVRGHWLRAQMSWTNDNRSLFMFISHGGRPHSMTRRTCQKLLQKRHLRLVDTQAVVEHAMHRLPDAPASQQEP